MFKNPMQSFFMWTFIQRISLPYGGEGTYCLKFGMVLWCVQQHALHVEAAYPIGCGTDFVLGNRSQLSEFSASGLLCDLGKSGNFSAP